MQAFKAVLALLALVAVGAQIVTEWQRLTVVRRLEGRKALAYYEQRRKGSDRALLIVTGILALGALAAIALEVVYHS